MPVGDGFDAISDLVAGRGDRVVAVGQAQVDGRDHFALARFTERGAPDPSFDAGGSLIVPTSAPYAYAAGGALLPDGRVVAVGASGQLPGGREPPPQRRRRSAPAATRPAVAAPDRRVLLFANAAVALPDGRVLSAGVATERSGHPGMALVRTSPEGGRTRRGTATAPRSSAPATARWPPTSCSTPRGRAVAAGDSSPARSTRSCSPASTAPAALDRSFGAQGVVLTTFPGAAMRARPRSRARATASSSSPASPARRGSGPQCGGGTARLALARYQGGDAAAPAPGRRRRAAAGGGGPAQLAVRLAADAPARPPRQVKRARALPAGQALPRQAQPAAPAREARALLLGSRTVSVPGRRARDVHREGAAQAPRARAAGCGSGSSSRAATRPAGRGGDAPRHAAARLTAPSPPHRDNHRPHAPDQDRRDHRPGLPRSRGAGADGRGRHGRRAAELLARQRRGARRDRRAASATRRAAPGARSRSCRTCPGRSCASARCATTSSSSGPARR